MNKRIHRVWFAILLLSIASCRDTTSSRYPGYSEIDNGVYYKLHDPGENGKKAGENDYLEVRMANSIGGHVFFDTEFQSARGTILVPFSGNRYFSMLSEGDSASILLPGGDLKYPGSPDTGMVEMRVRVLRILNETAYEEYINKTDAEADEQVLINRYLIKNKISLEPDSNGIYIESKTVGIGKFPGEHKTVVVRCTGSFLNGLVFDQSLSGERGTSFPWGVEGQFVPGFEKMLQQMQVGAKAKIILPSRLAFGAKGSSNGLVPPNTPVVYTLELVAVE